MEDKDPQADQPPQAGAAATALANARAALRLPTAGSAELHGTHGIEACANCGAPVTGHFCSNCGQRREHEIHSIWHFTQEATEDLTHADSRLWSTMFALLFQPGLLTREFLGGKRVKYLPPLRLYLVLSVLFFLILGSGRHEPRAISYHESNGKVTFSMVNPKEAEGIAARPGKHPRPGRIASATPATPGQAPDSWRPSSGRAVVNHCWITVRPLAKPPCTISHAPCLSLSRRWPLS